MKRAAIAAIALSVFAGSVAMADSGKNRNDRDDRRERVSTQHFSRDRGHDDRRGHDNRDDHRWQDNRRNDDRRWHDSRRDDDRRWHDNRRDDDRRDWRYQRHDNSRYRVVEYRRPWGYRQHSWRRGERLPIAYYSGPYRIYDYHRYGLRSPPRGYHWVRVDHDAVLAVIATGLVLDVVYNSFF